MRCVKRWVRRCEYACDSNLSIHTTADVAVTADLGGGKIVVGMHVIIGTSVELNAFCGWIYVGEKCYIGRQTVIYGNGGVEIGNDTWIAGHCFIVSNNHGIDQPDVPIHAQPLSCRGIKIGCGVWIGANAVVLDGVEIGDGAVIGAGSVVTRSVPAREVWVGNPARRLKSRPGGL